MVSGELSCKLIVVHAHGGQIESAVDAGLGFKLKDYLQLDVAAGTSVDYPERNKFLTVGYSVML